jgi:hypothetical protein
MPVVFDEVVGTVESENGQRPQAEQSPGKPAEKSRQLQLERLKRRLRQVEKRRARLRAD